MLSDAKGVKVEWCKIGRVVEGGRKDDVGQAVVGVPSVSTVEMHNICDIWRLLNERGNIQPGAPDPFNNIAEKFKVPLPVRLSLSHCIGLTCTCRLS